MRLDAVANRDAKLFEVDGLAYEVVRAAAQRGDSVLDDDVARDHHDHGFGAARLYLAQGVETRAVGQVNVQEDCRRLFGLEGGDARGDSARLRRRVAPATQSLRERPAYRGVVVNDENLFLRLFQKLPPERGVETL